MEFSFGIFTFHLYGFFIGLGTITAFWIVEKTAEVWDLPKRWPQLLLWWLLLPGFIGARLYHVIDYWEYYSINPSKIVAVWEGGLGIIGGLVGGVVGLWWASRKLKTSLLQLADLVIVGVPFGQAIGRLGNWANQEVYGRPTTLPWGIFIEPQHRIAPYLLETNFHPLFLYEALLLLFLGSFLIRLSRMRRIKEGQLLGWYLIGYGTVRFLLEPLRIVSWAIAGVPVASVFSGGMILLGMGILGVRRKADENQ